MNSNDSKNILKKSSSVVQFNPICKNNKLPLNIKLFKKKYNHLNQANENNYNFKNNLRKLYKQMKNSKKKPIFQQYLT